jgi:sarcosine oxidase subunit beta
MRQSLGVPTHILDVGEIRRLEPAVDTTGIECGIFGPDDGFINVPVVVGALVSECKRRGVVLAAGVEATGLQMRNGEVSGVYTTKGSIECDQVINAAGARASEVAGWAGVDLPIRNRRRTILAVPRPDGLAPDGPMVEDAEVEYYFRRDGDRVLFGLGKDENLSLDVTLDDGILDRARGFAAKRFPSLSQMEPTDWWSGIRPLTDDMLPIIGPGGGVSGLVHTCGWGGEGIQHAPAGGRLAAEWAVLGSARSLDGSPFLPDRFALRN